MKKVCLGILVCLVALVFLSGCKKENPLVGTWTYEGISSYYYTFNEDKTCSYTTGETVMKCTYEDGGTRVTIIYEGSTNANEFEYTIKNNKLNITDSFGETVVYEKK